MKRVLAVDPGSSKCGLAVVESDGSSTRILYRKVIATENIPAEITEADKSYDPELVVVGDGTRSKPVQTAIRDALPGKAMLVVDEQDTSIRARERYWIENPRRWWRRLLPSTLLVPPDPVDDFVAVILAERVLNAGD